MDSQSRLRPRHLTAQSVAFSKVPPSTLLSSFASTTSYIMGFTAKDPPQASALPPPVHDSAQDPVEGDIQTSPDTAEEDDLDVDLQDAESILQPAMSPIATRHGPETSRDGSTSLFPALQPPEPWNKRLTIAEPSRVKSSMAAALQTRHQRSQSAGESALKRLSKALPSLPSINIPTGLLQNIHTPSLFSSASNSPTKDGIRPRGFSALSPFIGRVPGHVPPPPPDDNPSPQPDLSQPRTLRSVASDDSMLYHSLSRMSSLGDDARFTHVRGQVNVRLKAIMDSFDGPSFKLPQMPSIGLLNTPLKKATAATDSAPGASGPSTAQTSPRVDRDPLDEVLETLTGDIVIMGGYRGSVLRSAKAPHRRLWVPVKVQLGVRKVNLEVGLDSEDEERMEETIIPDGMLKNIGPVDISRRLFKRLRECENARLGKLRVHDYGYDWRLSPHLLSRKLVEFLEKLPSNQPGVPPEQRGALVIAHSLGGLITRHAVNQRPELFSGVLYVGVPQRCISILGPLRNGDVVAFNEKLLTAQVNFSLRTSFVFLPEDGFCFVDKVTGKEYRIDFYDVENWIKYRLSPCVSEPALPPLTRSGTLGSLLSLSDSLPSLPLRARSITHPGKKHHSTTTTTTDAKHAGRNLMLRMNNPTTTDPMSTTVTTNKSPSRTWPLQNPSTALSPSTRARNIAYLTRTLHQTKHFRSQLAHNPSLQTSNLYPPLAIMYGKDMPTCCGARVSSKEAIARADAYDELIFASGDGVVLAKDAMLPEGYEVVKGGRVRTDRGHVGMLGDLVGVGKALQALVRGRKKGIGLGVGKMDGGGGEVRKVNGQEE
ncbi:hypothetical protein VTJ49DRAFT_1846 [Mycothermus thermophilus]|uniref:Uncharacterized protein n=1 Tax=Humicola insolens TaxID=85995 RepID=A0ABR3VB96_HUMIN